MNFAFEITELTFLMGEQYVEFLLKLQIIKNAFMAYIMLVAIQFEN